MSIKLLYRRRVNTVFGQSEVGKSWFGIYHCLRAVRDDPAACAVYIDYEDDATGMVTRLKAIGATLDEVRRVLYIQARVPLSDALVDAFVTGTLADFMSRNGCTDCVVIVIDSVDALISSAGGSSNSVNDARRVLEPLKKLAEDSGASVLTIDHESEKSGGQSKMQMGSSAKKQIIDGASLRADKHTPWRPGRAECSTDIVIAKDRHGLVRAQADDTDEMPRVARLVMRVDPEHGWASVLSLEPPRVDGPGAAAEIEGAVLSALADGGMFRNRLIAEVHAALGEAHSKRSIETVLDAMGGVASGTRKSGRTTGRFYELEA